MKKLPPKHNAFLLEWLKDHDASKAYVRAYKYKGNNANVLGPALLAKLRKSGHIEPALKAQEDRTEITADRVLKEIWRLSTVDVSLAYDANGNLKDIKDMPEDVRRAIAGIEVIEDNANDRKVDAGGNPIVSRTKKIKFWDKNKSLELLGKYFKMFTERMEINAVDKFDDLTDAQLALIAAGKATPADFIK